MRLYVKVLGGEECDVIADPDDSVELVKKEVTSKLKLNRQAEQKLLFRGKALQDGTPLSQYKLTDGSRLNLLLKSRDVAAGFNTSSPGSQSTPLVSSSTHPKTAEPSYSSSSIPDHVLFKALRRHFQSDSNTRKVVDAFQKVHSNRLSALSLDDLERILCDYNRTHQFLF